MGALKGLVLILAILIVVAMGGLAYGLYHKAANPDFRFFAAGQARPAGFGAVRLSVPAGCVIASSEVSDGRLFVRIGNGGSCDRIFVLDAASGAQLGSVNLETAP